MDSCFSAVSVFAACVDHRLHCADISFGCAVQDVNPPDANENDDLVLEPTTPADESRSQQMVRAPLWLTLVSSTTLF